MKYLEVRNQLYAFSNPTLDLIKLSKKVPVDKIAEFLRTGTLPARLKPPSNSIHAGFLFYDKRDDSYYVPQSNVFTTDTAEKLLDIIKANDAIVQEMINRCPAIVFQSLALKGNSKAERIVGMLQSKDAAELIRRNYQTLFSTCKTTPPFWEYLASDSSVDTSDQMVIDTGLGLLYAPASQSTLLMLVPCEIGNEMTSQSISVDASMPKDELIKILENVQSDTIVLRRHSMSISIGFERPVDPNKAQKFFLKGMSANELRAKYSVGGNTKYEIVKTILEGKAEEKLKDNHLGSIYYFSNFDSSVVPFGRLIDSGEVMQIGAYLKIIAIDPDNKFAVFRVVKDKTHDFASWHVNSQADAMNVFELAKFPELQ